MTSSTATTFDADAKRPSSSPSRSAIHAGDSLLAALSLARHTTCKTSAKAIWDSVGSARSPQRLRDDIEHARLFSLVMEGAALTYNLMLAEPRRRPPISRTPTRLASTATGELVGGGRTR